MASGSTVPRDPQTVSKKSQSGIPPGFIESQLEKTSGEVRLVEISTAILTICLTVLGYLLVLGILEHWILLNGLSALTRSLLLISLFVVLILYTRRRLLPYVRYKISLAYAAHTIEQSEPRLKNSLLNFLFLRRQKKGVPDVVFRGLEHQAATGLSRVSLDLSIERKRLTFLGGAVIAIILFGALYTIFSPKSLAPAVGRMLFPWADIDVATRVTIRDVEPGSKNVAMRSNVEISATVKGLRDAESVTLVFSSAGGGAVDRRLPMQAASTSDRYDCQITEANTGMVNNLTYHIEAGDAVSKSYELQVMPAPSFQVTEVEYEYPAYTGLESRKVQGVGDLRAIEGTRVRIHAEATDEIEVATLHLQPGVEIEEEISERMNANGNRAECQLMLGRKTLAGDSTAEYVSYRLSLKTASGETNPSQIRHQISVLRDEAPIVEILMPQQATLELREDDSLTFEVRGRDPDFRLTDLWLEGHAGDREPLKIDLLGRSKRAGEPLRVVHRESTNFVPRDWDLKAGETISIFAVAIDNKQPAANRSETASVQVSILPPLSGNRPPKPKSAVDQDQNMTRDTEQQEPLPGQSGEGGSDQAKDGTAEQSEDNSSDAESDASGNASGQEQAGNKSSDDESDAGGNASGQEQAGNKSSDDGSDSSGGATGQQRAGNSESNNGSGNKSDQPKGSLGDKSSNAESEHGRSDQGERGQREKPSEADSGAGDEEIGEREANGETNGSSASKDSGSPDDRQAQNQGNDLESSQTNKNARQASGNDPNAQASENSSPEGLEESQAGKASRAGKTENSKVDNDGDAFEKLNEIIQQKSDGDRSSANSAAESKSSKTQEGSEKNQTSSQENLTQESGQPNSSSASQDPSSQRQPDQDSGTNAGGQTAGAERAAPREGAGQRDRISDSSESTAEQAEQSSDARAEASRNETGGGTGNSGDQPPPPGEGAGRDRRKSGTPDEDSQQSEEPSDGGVSERDSDSAKGQEGSRHGKGQEGGGQQSQQQGEGAAGSNTPSDAGKGASGEPGQGEVGSGQGSNSQSGQSEQPTGKSGVGSGEGSSEQSADSTAEKTRNGTGGATSSAPSAKPKQGSPPGSGGGGIGSDEPVNSNDLTEPGADTANLDYANQTTDLVLNYLEQQLDAGGIDEDLKKQFGWSDQDFSDFVRRYRTMKNKAELPGADGSKAKSNWENVLRSLGLTPPQRGVRTTATPTNRTSGLRESGRSRPPREDQNRFDAFRRDVLGR